ncbi:MAG: hypothetical protein IPL50_19845 [Chitinophagaceae bacterium]|nr:hypothetical protein [Chitinophagaceae bacterium]
MKGIIYGIGIWILLVSAKTNPKEPNIFSSPVTDTSLFKVAKWFSAWELVRENIYHINSMQPVEFLFFDDQYVYATSPVSIPVGEVVEGPKIFNQTLPWKKSKHQGTVTLPDKQIVPIGLMSFASPLDSLGQTAFFVMPLPDFWKNAGVTSKELGLDNLVTGVFLHEFSHTQQMRNFGRKMTEYEKKYSFKTGFSDDIVQDHFEADSQYNLQFRREVKLLYDAAAVKEKSTQKKLISQALEMLRNRQAVYFTREQEILKEIDDFFLSMEGIGQYSMYAWLIHPEGGAISKKPALAGVRRGGRSWSQEEGLALFLVLANLSETAKWAAPMFGKETSSVIEMIAKELQKK